MSIGKSKNAHASPNSALSHSFYCPQKADFTKIANFFNFLHLQTCALYCIL